MSSFFTTPASQRKRKRQEGAAPSAAKRPNNAVTRGQRPSGGRSARSRARSESISGSGSEDEVQAEERAQDFEESTDDELDETTAEKRLRLAERYLENVRQEVEEVGFDAAEIDRDLIAERLQEDVAESKGKVHRHIAEFLDFKNTVRTAFRADQRRLTSIACCAPYVYTVAKDMTVVKWELPLSTDRGAEQPRDVQGRRPKSTPALRPQKLASAIGRRSNKSSHIGHKSQILCAAASTTGRFLATGGLDRRLVIWDVSSPRMLKPVKVFTHHRDAVTGLAFRRGTNQLYSCSKDRTVKVWSLDELAYIETLFGHQDSIVGLASSTREICISVGSRDRTARLWKVGDESQLVFRGGGVPSKSKIRETHINGLTNRVANGITNGLTDGLTNGLTNGDSITAVPEVQYAEGSIDVIALVDDETFVSGADNGSISLWSTHKKKPVAIVPLAHGVDPSIALEDSYAEQGISESDRRAPAPPAARWITALASIPYSDLVLSGSWDGSIRIWRVSEDRRSLHAVAALGESAVWSATMNLGGSTQSDDQGKGIAGVVNDIAAFENGERGKNGVVIVAAVGNEHRLGRWRSFCKRSTAVKFEVPLKHLDPDHDAYTGDRVV